MRSINRINSEIHAIVDIEIAEKISSCPIDVNEATKQTRQLREDYIIGKVDAYIHYPENSLSEYDLEEHEVENMVRQAMIRGLRAQPEIFMDMRGVVKKLAVVNKELKAIVERRRLNTEIVVGAIYFESFAKKSFITSSKTNNKGVVTERRVPTEKERVY